MSSVTIFFTVFLAVGCLFSSRRYFLLPYIIAACLIPMNQRIYLGNLDFTVLRILVFAGMLRYIIRDEKEAIQWHGFDKLVLVWNISSTLVYTIQIGTLGAFLNRCGVMYDSLGMYWLCRHYFRSFDDITQCIKLFAICAIISTPLVAMEKILKTSIFSIFGPVGAGYHRGRFRCAGPFPHYIMLGCFWVSLIPLFYSSWKAEIMPKLNLAGIFCAISLVYFSASSTPLLTLMSIFIFWMCYYCRQSGKTIFIAICGVLILLHIVMQAPVWHLIARVNVFGGSTGWHRYYLFNQFIEHTSEWFVLGTSDTINWGPGLHDITNQYVLEGDKGRFPYPFYFYYNVI